MYRVTIGFLDILVETKEEVKRIRKEFRQLYGCKIVVKKI